MTHASVSVVVVCVALVCACGCVAQEADAAGEAPRHVGRAALAIAQNDLPLSSDSPALLPDICASVSNGANLDVTSPRGASLPEVSPSDPVDAGSDCVNVRDLTSDPIPDDAVIQRAVDSLPDGGGSVCFGPGMYRVTKAVNITKSHVRLIGAPGALIVVDPPDTERNKEAILVNPVGDLEGIEIDGLSFQVNNGEGGVASEGVIQLNQCRDCAVRGVCMFWDRGWPASQPKPFNTDGIVFAKHATGLVHNVVVDGIPKAGIYVAGGATESQGTASVTIDACEVAHDTIEGIGIAGSSRVVVQDCLVHDNGRYGMFIATAELGFFGELPTEVQVLGGHYDRNGLGIYVDRFLPDSEDPKNITITSATASDNDGAGIVVRAGDSITLDGITASCNGTAGIVVEDPAGPDVHVRQVNVLDPIVFHNSTAANAPGVFIHGNPAGVTIRGGSIFDDDDPPTQLVAIQIQDDGALYPSAPTDLQILNVDARTPSGLLRSAYDTVTASAQPLSGFYAIQHGGDPSLGPGLYAPVGSHYTDTDTDTDFIKATSSPDGWEIDP